MTRKNKTNEKTQTPIKRATRTPPSRSKKLTKIGTVYKSHIKKIKKITRDAEKSPRRKRTVTSSSKNKRKSTIPLKTTPKPLNAYQKFVKEHTQDPIYENMSGKDRLRMIAKEWQRENS
jgi:hypothetical protein